VEAKSQFIELKIRGVIIKVGLGKMKNGDCNGTIPE
jgi:hypothetical protein